MKQKHPKTTPLLAISKLCATFTSHGKALPAVDNVSFSINPGEVLGLVGESGSGKSILLRSIIGLTRRYGAVSGEVLWKGKDLMLMSNRQLRDVRGSGIATIFQEPMSSLNPLLTIERQITENLVAHTNLDRQKRRNRAVELLDMVGIPAASLRIGDYPHQFSGGMRQRVMIAIALASSPELLLADEPTTALDVTIQEQILKLILDLSHEMNMAIVLVTHDLGVAAQACDRLAVMYAGKLVEKGTIREILRHPRHPYSVGLLRSIPENVKPKTRLYSLPGTPPSLAALPPGCSFEPRCEFASTLCQTRRPVLENTGNDRDVACFNPQNTMLDKVNNG